MKTRASTRCLCRDRLAPTPTWRSSTLLLVFTAMTTGCGVGSDDPSAQPTVAAAVATNIITQPVDQTVTAGNPARFNVVTTGTSLSYQWQISANGGADWTDIPGAVAAIYTVQVTPFELNGYKFRVVVTGTAGRVTSSAATLSLGTAVVAPAISIQAAPVSITAGGDAVFTVTATGTALTYQWQLSLDNITWSNIAGATASTLRLISMLVADSGKRYRVVIGNSAGSITSNSVVLTVAPAPSGPLISAQPAARSVVVPQAVNFSVTATANPSPTYQWQVSTNGGVSFSDIANAASSSYTLPATTITDNGKLFRVRIANSVGSLFSASVRLDVTASQAAPTFTLGPENQAVVEGASASISSAAIGSPTPVYQWQSAAPGSEVFANVNGATSANLSTPPAAAADNCKRFRVLVSNTVSSLLSAPAYLTVTPPAPTPGPLQPRLAGAAFFQPQLNVTILANANLPASLPLGVTGIGADGTMTWPTAKAWIRALNAAKYLGFSDWRLPSVTPINGCAFLYNPYPSDPQGYAGRFDLSHGISAPGTRYARSTNSELAYLFYNVLGGTAKFSTSGSPQNSGLPSGIPLSNVAPREYWTSRAYGDNDGAALIFNMKEGAQYGYVAGDAGWRLNVIVMRTGDVTSP